MKVFHVQPAYGPSNTSSSPSFSIYQIENNIFLSKWFLPRFFLDPFSKTPKESRSIVYFSFSRRNSAFPFHSRLLRILRLSYSGRRDPRSAFYPAPSRKFLSPILLSGSWNLQPAIRSLRQSLIPWITVYQIYDRWRITIRECQFCTSRARQEPRKFDRWFFVAKIVCRFHFCSGFQIAASDRLGL